ncbi:unnamed protein product [Clavelina lepadiformis]|uniref:Cysteine and histidine-rich domain-containing protein 1 n=1 Tax=Clavelina lepadiformis TaxID=159417 RepID=A0ABP0FGH5_CLALP
MADTEIQCYNKACGKKFSPLENGEESCQFHPGVPVFHDALKGWSCCSKRTTDFTEFLKILGCTFGKHSNNKPAEELKPKVKTSKEAKTPGPAVVQVITPPPKPIKKIEDEVKPSVNEPLQTLPVKTTSSYNKEKAARVDMKEEDEIVTVGTTCRNGGCGAAYANGPNDDLTCVHHPGTAIFHEGMKFWSCCQRKTSDFTSFLNQEGCSKGKHLWKKQLESAVTCRYDWHQTGPNVIISVFAKNCNIDTSSFETNQVYLKASVDFEGWKHFDLWLNLYGVIDPKLSKVTVSGAKVEITLRKSRAMKWSKIGTIEEKPVDKAIEDVKNEEQSKTNDSEGSDLEGIDDVIFD